MSPDQCHHLTVDEVLEIHALSIELFGGSEGVRDWPLLESAVSAPQMTVGGSSPFADLVEVGAAYLFYLCRNHPFIDGNKQTALGACLTFLRLNGVSPSPDGHPWEDLTLDIASGKLDREASTKGLRSLIVK